MEVDLPEHAVLQPVPMAVDEPPDPWELYMRGPFPSMRRGHQSGLRPVFPFLEPIALGWNDPNAVGDQGSENVDDQAAPESPLTRKQKFKS
jgi:hypothetical protein